MISTSCILYYDQVVIIFFYMIKEVIYTTTYNTTHKAVGRSLQNLIPQDLTILVIGNWMHITLVNLNT
jgi:hypothetical protein